MRPRIRIYEAVADAVRIFETTAQELHDQSPDQPHAPALLHEIRVIDTRGRLLYFGIGALCQVFLVGFLAAISVLFPQRSAPIRRYLISALEPRSSEYIPHRVQRPIVARLHPERQPASKPDGQAPVRLPVLQLAITRPTAPLARREIDVNPLDLVASSADVPPSPIPTATLPILAKPPEPVQTGAFDSSGESAATGTTRSKASARPGVLEGTFSSAGSGVILKASATLNQLSRIVPFEILYKPEPAYTKEARDKKIKGEVILQVVFSAAGTVQIQRIVQSLGYGLEDSAETATRQIRFRPAMRDGTPIDWTALVHAKFESAR